MWGAKKFSCVAQKKLAPHLFVNPLHAPLHLMLSYTGIMQSKNSKMCLYSTLPYTILTDILEDIRISTLFGGGRVYHFIHQNLVHHINIKTVFRVPLLLLPTRLNIILWLIAWRRCLAFWLIYIFFWENSSNHNLNRKSLIMTPILFYIGKLGLQDKRAQNTYRCGDHS